MGSSGGTYLGGVGGRDNTTTEGEREGRGEIFLCAGFFFVKIQGFCWERLAFFVIGVVGEY